MKLSRVAWLAAALAAAVSSQTCSSDSQARENAYRANNLGVALLEQFDYMGAADAFRRALRANPAVAIARINLAIALLYVPDLDGAEREANEAARRLPDDPHPPYLLGLIERARGGREAQARAAFERVLQIDARDVGALINLGQIDLQGQRYAEAIDRFRSAVAEEPYSVTATYNLGLALTRAGRREEGQQAMQRSEAVRAGGYGIVFSANYLEQGRYAEAVVSTGAEPELVDPAVPDVEFKPKPVAATPDAAAAEGLTLIDFDGDGDLDLLVVWPGGLRLLRNDRGAFTDVTTDSGLAADVAQGGLGAVAGDYDNDGRTDLLVLRSGGNVLYHNDGNGRFSNATAGAGLPPYPARPASAAFVDFDHDGDLDLVIAGNAPLQLVRNNGDRTFTDITRQSGIAGAAGGIAVVPTDYDNHREVDLLVVTNEGPPALFKNLRDGTFRDTAADVGLRIEGRLTSVAAADINKDDFPDFFFGRAGAPGVFALSDGHRRFKIAPAPPASADAIAAQFVDYDNDGLLDLLTWSARGPRLLRQVAGGWMDVTSRAFAGGGESGSRAASARAFVSADVDGDGGIDIVSPGAAGGVDVWRNQGASRTPSVRVKLTGRASNRGGIGAKIDLRAGSLRQRLEMSAATPAVSPPDALFGLGHRPRADVVRVLWPSGILQAETTVTSPLAVAELDRKPSSCPFLYAWNGHRFEFVTDFMGGGEMGYWESPGVRNVPDPDEYVRIRDDQLKPRDGRLELRVTNELEEAVFFDRLELLAVTHPAGVEIFPDEGMTDPPKPFRLYAVRDLRPPARAIDEHGHDVTDRVAGRDREYVDDFALAPFRGYAEPHTLTLTLAPSTEPRVLLLTGWTDYAFSSDNVAAHQAGRSLQPPRLEVKGIDGRWRTLITDVGVPVGRPQTIVVDLANRLANAAGPEGGGSRRAVDIRLVTNMRIYWDQILVGTPARSGDVRVERMDPVRAQLRWRGFSAEVLPGGTQPSTYEYDRVTTESPWKTMLGRYTREGDVLELLTRVDDRFVVSRPGDEIALSFNAAPSGSPAPGSKRTFLLFADGFSKEMDINSASPERLEPLPFHGMTRYPYAPPEHYPDTPALRHDRDQYNTRIVPIPVPSLEIAAGRHERAKR